MLIKLLKLIYEKGLYSRKKMASDLHMSLEHLNALIDQLIRMKYIEKMYMPQCSGKCSGCSASCSQNSNIEFWKITDKGKKALLAQ